MMGLTLSPSLYLKSLLRCLRVKLAKRKSLMTHVRKSPMCDAKEPHDTHGALSSYKES